MDVNNLIRHSGRISSWIDLDSEDEGLRVDSEITLKQEIAWACHLSLQVLTRLTELNLSIIVFLYVTD